ncbi:hypothetical protein EV401DRAFT_2044491 [Pisolithus croceorrhizus]|nr:hypothetical protein EV401DRAFT_2044491 [Pisolithus croceorrhizus]
MNVRIRHLCAVPPWRWNTSNKNDNAVADDDLGDVCGICRVPYEGCCPVCKMSGDDFLLSTYLSSLWSDMPHGIPKDQNNKHDMGTTSLKKSFPKKSWMTQIDTRTTRASSKPSVCLTNAAVMRG